MNTLSFLNRLIGSGRQLVRPVEVLSRMIFSEQWETKLASTAHMKRAVQLGAVGLGAPMFSILDRVVLDRYSTPPA